MAKKQSFDRIPLQELSGLLSVDFAKGLSTDEVVERHKEYGQNRFTRERSLTLLDRIARQFMSPLVFILIIAAIITLLLREYVDSAVIGLALVINIIVGTLQESRAGKAFDALSSSQERRALIMRDGKRGNIDAADLVPGDVIILEGGYQVPADARILSAKDLRINEAVLTGEWLPVEKTVAMPDGEMPLAEQVNMAWMGTLIESGYGTALVVATGDKTEVGKIARSLSAIDESSTPLQANIRIVAHFLTAVIFVAVGVIFMLGMARSESLLEMFLLAVAVAVATVPSGLPAAVTVVLALGMETILKRGGLVRNLLAAETLGATTLILTDKTGTLTEAKMHLATVHTATSLEAPAEKEHAGTAADTSRIATPDDRYLLQTAVLASDAFIDEEADAPQKLTVHGRPIEKAIILGALEEGIAHAELSGEYQRLDYLRFESARRFGASLTTLGKRKTRRLHITGAPETLIAQSDYLYKDSKKTVFSEHDHERFAQLLDAKSKEGKRLIGAAYKDVTWDELPENADPLRADLTEKMVFVGVLAFEDPVREDVPASIAEVKKAGVKVIMLTGDNPETARTIAAKAGITGVGDELVIRGEEIEHLDDDRLAELMGRASVIARALPAHKLRIAKVLREHGEVVAMTGDGINDAPALQAASIGIAVGSGTEVAKQASDMVLIGNSFSVIVAAIEEGRRIIDNLKKILAYLLSGSFSEIFLIGGALIAGAPLPLLPTQILWTKIIEEGLMSFSFAFEGKDPTAMERSPKEMESKTILSRELKTLIFTVSVVTGAFLVALYFVLLALNINIEQIRTIMFAAISLDTIFFSFSLKSFRKPLWKINPFDNRFLLIALVLSLSALALALGVPFIREVLSLTALGLPEMGLLVAIGLFNLAVIEYAKYLLFERTAYASNA